MAKLLNMVETMSAQQKLMEEKVNRIESGTPVRQPEEAVKAEARRNRPDNHVYHGPKVDPPPKFYGKEEEWRTFSLKM